MSRYRASYYNLQVAKDSDETLIFNGITGALTRAPAPLRDDLLPYLGPERDKKAGTGFSQWQPEPFEKADLPLRLQQRFDALLDAGIFIPDDLDERDALRRSYESNRSRAPFFITITTTLDCNMRCYYCYQKEGELEHMTPATCDELITWTKAQLVQRGFPKIYVDWYGGEPMLNQAVIRQFSSAMIPFCDANGVTYKSSMICNGTAWPIDAAAFVREHRIHSLQVSIDGPERHHNKRRGLIDGNSGKGREASFDEVMRTIDALIGATKIYLRINVDPYIGEDALELIELCRARGWLERDKAFFPYLAVINAMTEHCGFIGKSKKFLDFEAEFDRIQQAFYAELGQYRDQRSLEVVQYFPNRVQINCAAVSHNAVVFGPNGLMYKCGLDVGDHHRAHDSIGDSGRAMLAADVMPADRWDRYDPFKHARCKECQYLPVCMGGCPKAQIDGDEAQIKMQSAFWENNFDRIILQYDAAAAGSA
jgi:uncharacterized protein